MTQTTSAFSVAAAKLEVSANGTDWKSLGPGLITSSPSGGEQQVGSTNVADGDAPVVTNSNKTGMITHEITALYTETADEPWLLVWDAFKSSDKRIYFRYSPKGGAGGDKLFTATNNAGTAFKCPIINCLPPATDANSGEASRFTFSLAIPKFTDSTIAT